MIDQTPKRGRGMTRHHYRVVLDEAVLRELLGGHPAHAVGHNDRTSVSVSLVLHETAWTRQLRDSFTDPREALEFLPPKRRGRTAK